MIEVKFSTNTLTEDEARALINLISTTAGFSVAAPIDLRAPDGFPMQGNAAEMLLTTSDKDDGPGDRQFMAPGGLDSAGTPWDERIHASTRTTNKDGTWTRRRNTPDEVFATVMAELKGAPVAPPPPPEPSAAEAFSAAPPPPPPAPKEDLEAAATRAVAAAIPGAPAFVAIMGEVTKAQAAGTMTGDRLKEILAQCGLDGLGKLATADDGTRSAVMALVQG